MISDKMTLTTVIVARKTYTADGMGGGSYSTVLTTLTKAAIWQAGSNSNLLSGKVANVSSHVLAFESDDYTFTDDDKQVVYGSKTYDVVGHQDDVMNQGRLSIIGLDRIT